MTVDIKVPVLPESVADATIGVWHKKPGEAVKRDENLVDIETDKVVLEVVAPEDGILETVLKNSGDTVLAQEVIALFKAGASKDTKEASTNGAKAVAAAVHESKPTPTPTQTQTPYQTIDASPSVRRRMAENGTSTAAGTLPKSVVESATPFTMPMTLDMGNRPSKRVPMSRLRARIAERLLSAQHNAAILTTFNEINMKPVMELRAKHKDAFEQSYHVKLGFMSFFVKATIEALKAFPSVNASLDDKDVVYHGYYDIGVAVSTDRGLVVPVLRDADLMSMATIEKTIADMGQKAKTGQLTIEEMTGGTFTISNGGVFGSLLSTPILNPPQTGILGMHKIEERPVVEKGEIVIRPMMYVALSYDHRLIDGRESVQFLATIKSLLEEPARMLLEI